MSPADHHLGEIGLTEHTSMDGTMYTIDWPRGTPSLQEAASALKVQPSDLDPGFGVVLVDPKTNTYTVLCRAATCSSAAGADGMVKGPFSNPAIGGYGPPR
jgi:hypothetical protein